MRIISLKTLKDFYSKPEKRDSQGAIETWYHEVKGALWKTSADIKILYPSASFVAGNRVVFNIGGNKYRLVVKIKYANLRITGLVFIRFIGTHEEYDRIKVEEI